MKRLLAFAALSSFAVHADVWTLYKGTTIVKPRVDYASLRACSDAVPKKGSGSYTCRTIIPVPLEPPIEHAMHGGLPVADAALWPTSSIVTRTTEQLSTTGYIPPVVAWDQEGAWRLLCGWTKMSFDDPIVYPGKPGLAHHHTFYGNDKIDAFTTQGNIRASGNGASCRGGTINLSGYWHTSLIDTKSGKPLAPEPMIVYYKDTMGPYMGKQMVNGKGEYPRTNVLPVGFRMIAGNPGAAGPFSSTNEYASGAPAWGCFMTDGTFRAGTQGQTIPTTCQPGDTLRAEVTFPQCWDGINLDSPDHKAHVVDVRRMSGTQVFYDPYKPLECPSTHPKYLPAIRFAAQWKIPAGVALTDLRLSSDPATGPAGYTWHADWMNGHDPKVMEIWTRECLGGDRGYDAAGNVIAITRRDCQSAHIGDGRTTIEWDGN